MRASSCLDPTAIEHRSRRLPPSCCSSCVGVSRSHSHRASIATARRASAVRLCSVSRSHRHRASIATTCSTVGVSLSWMVSIPQPSSIDRDEEPLTNPALAVLLSRSHEHRSRPRGERGGGVALRVSIPQPSSIDRDARPVVLLVVRRRVSIPQPSSIDRDSWLPPPRGTRLSCLDPTVIEHQSRRRRSTFPWRSSGCLDPTVIEHQSRLS